MVNACIFFRLIAIIAMVQFSLCNNLAKPRNCKNKILQKIYVSRVIYERQYIQPFTYICSARRLY